MSDTYHIATAAPSGVMTKRLVNDLNFHIGGKVYRFMPKAVTPADFGYLLQLLIVLVAQPRIGEFDVEGYINEHNLWHCFEVKE